MQLGHPHVHGALELIACPASATVANGAEFVSFSPRDGENTNGRISMQAAANSNLILTDLSSFKWLAGLQKDISHAAFYQQVLSELIRGAYRKQTFPELGNRLVALADHAYGVGQMRAVEEGSQLLLNLPLGKEYESIGRYYQALCIYRRGRFAEARVLLEQVAGELPLRFTAKALLAVSATYYQSDDLQSFLSLNVEASRAATSSDLRDPQTFVRSQRHIAVLKSIDGDHRGALSDLERLFPLARAFGRWQPYSYYEHLNSLAVELMEAGRLEEARNASKIALASPFAAAYPEWRETREEIELRGYRASRSVVAFYQANAEATSSAAGPEGGKLVHLPAPERDDSPSAIELSPKTQPARVLSMQEWKKKMPEKSNDDPQVKHTEEQIREMTTSQRLVRIMNLISNEMSDDELGRVLSFLEQIALERKGKS
jgi:tetratricopeptide (TPR) repeat protein